MRATRCGCRQRCTPDDARRCPRVWAPILVLQLACTEAATAAPCTTLAPSLRASMAERSANTPAGRPARPMTTRPLMESGLQAAAVPARPLGRRGHPTRAAAAARSLEGGYWQLQHAAVRPRSPHRSNCVRRRICGAGAAVRTSNKSDLQDVRADDRCAAAKPYLVRSI